MKSILQKNKECFITHTTNNLDLHHVMNGAYRDKSTQYGLTIYLNHDIHMRVHEDAQMMKMLKKYAQEEFEKLYSHELWMKEFRKNYI